MKYTHIEGVIKKQSKLAFIAIATIYAVAMTMSFAFGADAAPPDPKPKEEKVDVCHVAGNGSYQLISVSEKALPAHEAHGDFLAEILGDDINDGIDCYDAVHEVSVDVSPKDGSVVELELDEGFVWTVDASHLGGPLTELEVDHSLEGIIPEFTVYADEANPYGDAATQLEFEGYGVSVTYDEAEMTWEIDFGPVVTHTYFVPGGITFYIEVTAEDGHQFGDMFDVQPEYTFAYTFDVLEP